MTLDLTTSGPQSCLAERCAPLLTSIPGGFTEAVHIRGAEDGTRKALAPFLARLVGADISSS